jgi:ABC-type branched-subunit amino acid transport system substrate-binding protein
MFAYLKGKYPDMKRVVVMGFRDPTSEDTMAVIVKAAESQGYEVAEPVWYEMTTRDYSAVITKALSYKPDILDLGWATAGMAGAQIKTARGLGFKGLTIQHTQGDLETIISIAGKEAEGHLYLGGGSDEAVGSEKMKKFKLEYIKRFGRWNEGAAQELYVPLMLGKAIQKAGTFKDPDKIVKVLGKMSFRSDYIKGNTQVYFTKEADRKAVLVSPTTFVQIQNGAEKAVTVLKEMQ